MKRKIEKKKVSKTNNKIKNSKVKAVNKKEKSRENTLSSTTTINENTVKNKGIFRDLLLKGKQDYILLTVTLILVAIGLIILLSASSMIAVSEGKRSYEYFTNQSFYAAIGIVLMLIISKIDYKKYKRLALFIYIITFLIMLFTGVFGLEDGGGKRWIRLPIGTLQPSEFAKVALILVCAACLANAKDSGKLKTFSCGFLKPVFLYFIIFLILYKLQNHLSCAIIMGVILVVQMFYIGTRIRDFFKCGIAAALGGSILLFHKFMTGDTSSFRTSRIQTWLHLDQADVTTSAWQITQSLYAIGSGGIFGVGIGESKQKYLYLPESQNDFIFAILAEELGFIGCISVILLFLLFIWRGIVITNKAQDSYGKLIALGVTVLIGFQAFLNIAVVTSTLPVTGVALPFFSAGGSAMIANLMAVGLLLSVSRTIKSNNNNIEE